MMRRFAFVAGGIFVIAGTVFFWRGILNLRTTTNSAADSGKPIAAKQVPPAQRSPTPAPAHTNQFITREFDPAVNPYAGALREPGKAKRAWDPQFLIRYQGAVSNAPIRFELTDGQTASGTIKITQYREGELTYMSGELTQPERGRFFFLTPPAGGKAGKAAGVVEFEGSQTAYRVEPTGENGTPELWRRRLEEVRCQTMPLVEPDRANEVAELPPLRPDLVPDYAPDYNSNIVSLQSYPGAAGVLLLDFFGGYTPTWGGVTYPRPNVNNAQIKDVWKRVAEDYMPFKINVTTDIRVYLGASATSRQKCVFSPSISAMPSGAAGVAYIGSWDWGSDTVCWSIYTSGKAGAEVGSHEVGHTVGLGHQGTSSAGYFDGHGSGATGWAPIMGAGYYQPVVSWAKGEYQGANNREDELYLIVTQNANVVYRADDTGNTLAASRYLEVYPGNTASAEGVIERTGDTDSFQFTTGGGAVSLTASPVGDWANLALSGTVANASEAIIATNNPPASLSAGISATLPAGTYTFRVTGVGRSNPLTDGFSSYGSLGYYSITGAVAAARLPTRLSVAEHSPNGTVVGTVPPNSTNSAFGYSIVSGNTGGTFAIDSRGLVRVANNTLLDYSRLATNTMLAVQFELLINISDLANPALSESNRRVVISVLNVNDPPVVTGFSAAVVEHTQSGVALGTVTVADPDFSEPLSYRIVAGDPAGRFVVDQAGTISVAQDLDATVQNLYTLTVAVNDNVVGNPLTATGYVTLTVVSNRTWCQPGAISYAAYDNTGPGTVVSDLTGNARWPRDPTFERQLSSFEEPINRADNYGAAMRGYLIPAVTGTYTFYIASDDSSELWFSTTTNAATMTRIAYVNGYTGSRQWNKFNTQQSSALSLIAGQGYYLEARMKEGGGDDNLAVAWKGPATGNRTNVIAGQYLAPGYLNFVPHLSGFTATLHQDAFTGAAVGAVAVSDANARDAHTFAIISGNTAGLFTIDTSNGTVRVADGGALSAAAPGSYTLQVRALDSGSPPLAATATATINLVASDTIAATSIQRELWYNIGSGNAVSDLTNNAAYPRRPDAITGLSSFASASDIADNFGSRIRAYLTPATSGVYRFFVSSDDNSSLLFSANDNPANAVRAAYVSGWTDVNTWTSSAQQMSAARTLTAGQRYYIEALQKEGGGGDHVEVAWAGPGIVDANNQPATNIIDGSFLAPVDINYPPQINNQSLPVSAAIPNGTAVGRVAALDSPLDTLSFKIVDGNTNNMFALDPATGVITVLDNTLIAAGSASSFPLTIAVQDSGYGGLYPLRNAQATVTINVQSAAASSFVWTGAANTNNWANPGNWGGITPPNGARLTFGFPWQQPNLNDTLTAATWVQFTNGGFTVSGNSLRLQTGLTNRGDNTWGINTTLNGAQTWHNASGAFQVKGAITNSGLTLVIVANSDFRISGPISGAGGLTRMGTARLLMQGAHTYTGNTVVAAASGTTTALEVNGADDLDIRNSDLTMNGRMDLGSHDAIIGALNGNGLIFANDLTRTLTLGANNHAGSFSGGIQNAASGSGVTLNVVKTGTGTQTFTGANSHSGITVVTGGTLSAANANALGTAAGGTVVNTGATLALQNNIVISAEPVTLNGAGFGASGALRNDSGLNSLNGPISLGSATTIRAASGRLTLGGQWNTAGNSATLTFDTVSGAVISVSGGIPGVGSLVKNGGGTLLLNGASTFLGSTIINLGQISLGAGGSLAGTPTITLAGGSLDATLVNGGWILWPGQTLQGAGVVSGTATIRGALVPAASGGTLSFTGNILLAGTTALEIGKNAGLLTNNLVLCYGRLTPGGTLTVTQTGSDPLTAGDSFRVLSAAAFGSGSFSAVNLPSLSLGLVWNTSRLAVDGTISVEPATPPQLAWTLSTNALTLSWPSDYSNYVLQGQTNPLGQGLSPDWYAVPGVLSNTVSLPIDPGVGSALYRLAQPQ
ncbi:MAG TPA: cadherin domain-containing protein [Verrucomicrobiae bacterium]